MHGMVQAVSSGYLKPVSPSFHNFVASAFSTFSAFLLHGLESPQTLVFCGVRRTLRISAFSLYRFESLILKTGPTGFITTGLRWPGSSRSRERLTELEWESVRREMQDASEERERESGPLKLWQPWTWQDSTLLSPPGNQAIFSTFWGDCLSKLHRRGEKRRNSLVKFQKSSGENSPKL